MTERELCECHHIQKLERNGHTASCNRNHRKSLTDSQKAEQKKASKPKRIDKVGTKNTFKCSDGTRVTQEFIVEELKALNRVVFGANEYVRCEGCGDANEPTNSLAHIIAKSRCKNIGKTELIWDIENTFPACFKCNAAIENPKGLAWMKLKNIERCIKFIAENDYELFQKFQANSIIDLLQFKEPHRI